MVCVLLWRNPLYLFFDACVHILWSAFYYGGTHCLYALMPRPYLMVCVLLWRNALYLCFDACGHILWSAFYYGGTHCIYSLMPASISYGLRFIMEEPIVFTLDALRPDMMVCTYTLRIVGYCLKPCSSYRCAWSLYNDLRLPPINDFPAFLE